MSIYTATQRGYSFGGDPSDGLDWQWTTRPALGFGEYRTARAAVYGQDGTIPLGADVGGAGQIVFEMEHSSGVPATAEAAELRLRAAFAPFKTSGGGVDELTLVMYSGTYVLRGRPARPDVQPVYGQFGYLTARAVFETTDPVLYSATVKTAFVSMPVGGDGITVAAGGITVAAGGITVAGGSTSGDSSAVNAGTADVDWTCLLTGPITNPRVTVNGKIVVTTIDLPAGSTALLDSRKRSITVDGVPVVGIAFESQWSKIPGNGVPAGVSLRGDAGTGTGLVSWRDGSY